MIRQWQSENTAPLLSLWLKSTTVAHPFIDAEYWKENEAMVRDVYLRQRKRGYGKMRGNSAGLSA